MSRDIRPISWLKGARKDFGDFPPGAQTELARALTILAEGRMPDIAKPLTGFGPGIMELALRHRGDAFRVVYALKIDDDIWVIHAFQKKSKSGIKTPQQDIELIEQRLKRLRETLK
jgi:phage-related protein